MWLYNGPPQMGYPFPPQTSRAGKKNPTLKDYKKFVEFLEWNEERKSKNKKEEKKEEKKDHGIKLTVGQVYMMMTAAVPLQFLVFAYIFFHYLK